MPYIDPVTGIKYQTAADIEAIIAGKTPIDVSPVSPTVTPPPMPTPTPTPTPPMPTTDPWVDYYRRVLANPTATEAAKTEARKNLGITPTGAEPKEGETRINPTTNQRETYTYSSDPAKAAQGILEWKPESDLGLGADQKIVTDSETVAAKTAQQILDEAKAATDAAAKKDAEIASLTKDKTIADLKTELGISDLTKPVAVNFTDTYTALRTSYGLDDMEGQINSISSQMRDIQASLTAGIHAEAGELRPMELIGARQTELQNQATDKLNALTNAKAVLVDEYNTKLTTVNNIMQFKQLDYNAAKDDYNTAFTQVVQLQNLLMTEKEKALSQQNAQQDNARANLTVMMNLMSGSNLTLSQMSDDFKTTYAKEALKAGISIDSLTAFLNAKPGTKIDHVTSGYDENGNQITSFFSYNNGNPILLKTIQAGGVKGGADTQSILDDFTKTLTAPKREEITMMWFREELIRKLQTQFPQIDPDDISRKVYEYYSDEYIRQLGG